MTDPPILTLRDIRLGFGGQVLLEDADLAVHPGEQIALVGRNGSGKSTLMRLMAGLTAPDSGTRFLRPGTHVGYMAQEPDFSGSATLADFAAAALDPADHWRVEMAADGVGLDLALSPDVASGGERRRAALVRILAEAPDLMLLDEPTNHLDIAAIGWLETYLAENRTAFVAVSHDRTFLRTLTRRTIWLDRGELRQIDRGFDAFEAWRDKTFDEEDSARHKLDRRIRAEGRWAVEGISARRKRNQGRVRRLAAMRAERRARIDRPGTAAMAFSEGPVSGRLVIEAEGVGKSFGDRVILRDFSIRIHRGERVALVGPNGAGKTTLLNILTGALGPETGHVRLGVNLQIAKFDQGRSALGADASLWETLTGDAEIGAAGRNDQIMVRGRPQHVVGYLKQFLFAEDQARGPVSALSGGERARLLLARLMARDSNLLVLDEPTNDLDIETLDLLQELISDYAGTVVLISHDRDFIDRVATTTVAMQGDGRAVIHAGGWSDSLAQRPPEAEPGGSAPAPARRAEKAAPARPARRRGNGLSFTERHRLERLPDEIARLEAEIGRLEGLLGEPDLYSRAPDKFATAGAMLAERQTRLAAAEEAWLALEARREAEEG